MDSSNITRRQTEVDIGADHGNHHDAVYVGSSEAGNGKHRIQPIDTHIRLQLGQKQVLCRTGQKLAFDILKGQTTVWDVPNDWNRIMGL